MKIRASFEGLERPPMELENADSILIYDDFGNPILVVQKLEKGQIYVVKASEPGFQDVLRGFGIGLRASVRKIK